MSEQTIKARLSIALVEWSNYIPPPDPSPEERNRIPWPVKALAMLPDGRIAVAVAFGVDVWDLGMRTKVCAIGRHAEKVDSVLVLRDGRVASGGGDNQIQIWDPIKYVQTACLDTGVDNKAYDWDGTPTGYTIDGVKALAELPDGTLAAAHWNGTIHVWNPNTGKLAGSGGVRSDHLCALAVLNNGQLACGTWEKPIAIWDPTTFLFVRYFDNAKVTYFGALMMLPDGHLASASSDYVVRIWDPATGSVVHALEGHTNCTEALATGPRGTLVSGSEDKTIRIWDTATGQEVARLDHDTGVTSLLALPDGRILVGDKLGRLHWLGIQFN